MMQTFVGNIEGRLDEKGRIFIPAAYRRILAEADSKRIVMRRDTDNECLMFYPEQVWNEKVETLRAALDEWNPEDQLILMQFMADAEYLELDGQGRILLQKKNLETIGAQNDVLFVGGAGDTDIACLQMPAEYYLCRCLAVCLCYIRDRFITKQVLRMTSAAERIP